MQTVSGDGGFPHFRILQLEFRETGGFVSLRLPKLDQMLRTKAIPKAHHGRSLRLSPCGLVVTCTGYIELVDGPESLYDFPEYQEQSVPTIGFHNSIIRGSDTLKSPRIRLQPSFRTVLSGGRGSREKVADESPPIGSATTRPPSA